MIRAVLFDLDDTLLDTTRAIRRAARTATARLGVPEGRLDEVCATWWVDPGGFFAAYDRGELSFAQQREARLVRVCSEHGLPALDDRGRAAWLAAYESALVDGVSAFPDVSGCLDALAGLPLGVVTNIGTEHQVAKLRSAGLGGRFQVVLGVDRFGARKPAPDGFLAGCAGLGVRVEEAVFVGDSLRHDVLGAAAAGLRGVWLDRVGTAPAPAGVERIRSLGELPPLLELSVPPSHR